MIGVVLAPKFEKLRNRTPRYLSSSLIPLGPRYLEDKITDLSCAGVACCSGQLIPDSILRFSSAATGEMPSLNA